MIERDGMVAIRRIPAIPQLIQVGGNGYVFTVKHNISLAWVKKEDVDSVLNLRNRHCSTCGTPKPMYYYCDETHLRRWNNGGR